jgi:hypothetical protein
MSIDHWLPTFELSVRGSNEICCSLCSSFHLMNCVETSHWRSTDIDNEVH